MWLKKPKSHDNWVITHDPLTLDLRDRQLHIDLGARKVSGQQSAVSSQLLNTRG